MFEIELRSGIEHNVQIQRNVHRVVDLNDFSSQPAKAFGDYTLGHFLSAEKAPFSFRAINPLLISKNRSNNHACCATRLPGTKARDSNAGRFISRSYQICVVPLCLHPQRLKKRFWLCLENCKKIGLHERTKQSMKFRLLLLLENSEKAHFS